jgi:hypothetical protein
VGATLDVSRRLLRTTTVAATMAATLAAALAMACEVALDAPPPVPADAELGAVATPTSSSVALLRGTRPANTALLVDGIELVARDRSTAFRLALPLDPGLNSLLVQTRDAGGQTSAGVLVSVTYDVDAPGAVTLAPLPPARTARAQLVLEGTKDDGCRVVRDGAPLTEVAGDADTFTLAQPLVPGRQRLRFACVDEAGNEGEFTELAVERFATADIPFALVPPPQSVAAAGLELSAACDDDVEAQVGGDAPVRCASGTWTARVDLALGANTITVRSAFVGELGVAARVDTFTIAATPGEGEGEGEGE